jgi:DNA-binding CsgD family transcriptional regulator
MALVPADPPSPVRTWAAATHARTSWSLGRRHEAEAAADEALAAADALGLDSAWADTAVSLARMRGGSDLTGRLEEALVRARRSGDTDVEMRVLFNLAVVPYEAGDVPRRCAGSTPRWPGRPSSASSGRSTAPSCATWAWRPATSRGDWDGSLELADRLARVPEMAAHVRAAGLLVQVGRGDPTARRAGGPGARADRSAGGARPAAARDGRGGDRPRRLGGGRRTAVERARTAARQLRRCGDADRLAVLRLVATALAPVGDAAAAARLPGTTRGAALGRRGAGAGRPRRARRSRTTCASVGPFGVEAAAWQAGSRPRRHGWPAGRTGAVAGRGRRVRLRAPSTSRPGRGGGWPRRCSPSTTGGRGAGAAAAAEVAARLGATPLLVGGHGPGAARVGWTCRAWAGHRRGLTPREAEVLRLLRPGRTNRQIGAELYMSEKTASVHVSRILAKLGAGGRTEAVALAAARGLLTPAPG